MAFEELKDNVEHIHEEFNSYIKNSIGFYKLKLFKLSMKLLIVLFKYSLILAFVLMVVFFSSVALAFALSEYFESYITGFSVVGGGYFILGLLFILLKKKWIERFIIKKFSKIFFNN
ncbi:competence protein [Flavobacterium cellulosilyticum]|uniref:Competence protein n=1 Tax=Flavobacterium cellulosilyticum TaxID=2541731 RepID=A0A4R5CHH3_9FLAO|nr:competence protein [Flavobacterium cellulosilyticum]TDD99648.1 competence protein [Flavobacterium cellulosilyticum]